MSISYCEMCHNQTESGDLCRQCRPIRKRNGGPLPLLKDAAYQRVYSKNRYHTDPEYREKKKKRNREYGRMMRRRKRLAASGSIASVEA